MKRDHATLDTIRLMAIERVRDGEAPSAVIASYGFSRTSIYRWLKAAAKPGLGLRALRACPARRTPPQPDTAPGMASVPLGQRQGSSPIWARLRPLDALDGSGPDRAKVRHPAWPDRSGRTAGQARPDPTEAAAARLSARPGGHRAVAARNLSGDCTPSESGRWGGFHLG